MKDGVLFFLGLFSVICKMVTIPKEREGNMTLPSADSKVQEICDILKKETLDPAQEKANQIVQNAENEAKKRLQEAENQIAALKEQHARDLEREKNTQISAVQLSIQQAVLALRQSVTEIFTEELQKLFQENLKKSDVCSKIIDALVQAVDKEGLSANLRVILPQSVTIQEILNSLVPAVKKRLEKGGIEVGKQVSGVILEVKDQNLGIAVTDETLLSLLQEGFTKELREVSMKG